MLPYRKKLIEVALPLKAINEASAREKSIRHGHPSTLHLWWARRPLAACRAVLFSSLVDDPDSDPAYRHSNGQVDEESAGRKRADLFNLIEALVQWENSNDKAVLRSARAEIARCVASRLIETGKLNADQKIADGWTAGDIARKAHSRPKALGVDKKTGRMQWHFECDHLPPMPVLLAFLAEHAPPVLDPFCGGGSIPLEAQRLGLRAYASDLNPVPVLITKALIEIPPKFAGRPPVNPDWQHKSKEEKAATVWEGDQGLAEDVRYYGKWMRDEAEKRIGQLYPKVKINKELIKDWPDLKAHAGDELTVIAWIWARTVASPNPAVESVHVPLVRSFWLSSKRGIRSYIEPLIDRSKRSYRFAVRVGLPPTSFDPNKGTVVRTGATCLLSGVPIPFEYIREEGKKGRISSVLMAIVADGPKGRVYLPALADHEAIAASAKPDHYPDTDLPKQALSMRVMLYGMDKHHKLFTKRQLVELVTFSDLVLEARARVQKDVAGNSSFPRDDRPLEHRGSGKAAYADAIATYLAFLVDQLSNQGSTLTAWYAGNQQLMMTFSRQALAMVWDYAESNPFCEATGSFHNLFERLLWAFENIPAEGLGQVEQADAAANLIAPDGCVIATDPPYYDDIGYSDLSDYFYAWMRRSLSKIYPKLLSTLLTPKAQELIATPYRHSGGRQAAKEFFEHGLHQVFERMYRKTTSDFPLVIFYAFKQSEDDDDGEPDNDGGDTRTVSTASTGWETILAALVDAGFLITGTWPMRTESNRGLKSEVNALASSVILSCLRREANAALGTRKEFLGSLRKELPTSLRSLQHSNIAPVDLAQAVIGPGMAVFTRYAKVIESDGSPMTVRTALGIINQVLDEVLAEQEGDFDADTRWALAWFEQFGTAAGAFGEAETLSKAKNTAINGLVEAGIVKAKGGKVQLVSRDELPADWNPTDQGGLTVWEITQHLIRTLQADGEPAAAELLNRLGGLAETGRELAYRLYSLCERKKWADEALAYNSLVTAWPELTKLALAERTKAPIVNQPEMFER